MLSGHTMEIQFATQDGPSADNCEEILLGSPNVPFVASNRMLFLLLRPVFGASGRRSTQIAKPHHARGVAMAAPRTTWHTEVDASALRQQHTTLTNDPHKARGHAEPKRKPPAKATKGDPKPQHPNGTQGSTHFAKRRPAGNHTSPSNAHKSVLQRRTHTHTPTLPRHARGQPSTDDRPKRYTGMVAMISKCLPIMTSGPAPVRRRSKRESPQQSREHRRHTRGDIHSTQRPIATDTPSEASTRAAFADARSVGKQTRSEVLAVLPSPRAGRSVQWALQGLAAPLRAGAIMLVASVSICSCCAALGHASAT